METENVQAILDSVPYLRPLFYTGIFLFGCATALIIGLLTMTPLPQPPAPVKRD